MMERSLKAKIFTVFLLFTTLLSADLDLTVSNTNYTISQGSIFPGDDTRYLYNYDRLRVRADYKNENFFATIIGDSVNYLGSEYINSASFGYIKNQEADTPTSIQTSYHDYGSGSIYAKLYRLYGGYEDESNRVTLGLQNITMGVGRVWNPTNLFNPRNPYALEPDEIYPVAALNYTRHINDVSHLTLVASQKEDYSYKYALRYKAFLDVTDIAFNFISSDETQMLGYEIEANLFETGIEVRSEGAYIKNSLHVSPSDTDEVEFFQGIIGADYGFENGLTLIVEALYSSKSFDYSEILLNLNSEISSNLVNTNFYLGTTLSYSFNLFLDGSIGYIESFDDTNSRFITPTLTYTLNDFNTFSLGAMIDSSNSDTYYFNYSLNF